MQMFCCRGYCMDLLKELSKTINFTYSLALSPDGQFGNYIVKNSSGKCYMIDITTSKKKNNNALNIYSLKTFIIHHIYKILCINKCFVIHVSKWKEGMDRSNWRISR